MRRDVVAGLEARPEPGVRLNPMAMRRAPRARRVVGVCAAIALAVAPTLAQGQQLPTGGSVAAGSASIGAPSNGALTISQSSQRAVINWNAFSVGRGGVVNFDQPNAASATLNRVTGGTPSTIAGEINAPGAVLLVNPNGVEITKSGVVNTGGFAASTLDVSNSDFMSGNYTFSGSGASASVINGGRINVSDGGFAALLGGHVANNGIISARLGKVALGSGEVMTLDLAGDGFLSVGVPTEALGKIVDGDGKPLVSNKGKIDAAGGAVYLSAATAAGILRDAVNVPGSIRADTVGASNGKIVIGGGQGGVVKVGGKLAANGGRTAKAGAISLAGAKVALTGKTSANGASGGTVAVTGGKSAVVSGEVSAKGGAGKGGVVTVSADEVKITGRARIDASGATGGVLLIGGDYQGGAVAAKDFSTTPIVDALITDVAAGAKLVANGTAGDGGDVVVWSDAFTSDAGTIRATGAGGGQGGFAEVSGHLLLDFTGPVDLAGPGGKGALLLDPENVTISSSADSGGSFSSGTYTPSGDNSVINVNTLEAALASGNVVISTGSSGSQTGDITVANAVSWTSGDSLTLSAYHNVVVDAALSGGAASVVLRADNTGRGSGTVSFGSGVTVTATGGLSIYYNPTTFGTPTSYAANGGTGTAVTAYMLVNTLANLEAIGANSGWWSDNFALGGNINANNANLTPIGNSSTTFKGNFDGQGYVVSNIGIDSSNQYIGLFGYVGGGGTVANLGVTGSVTGVVTNGNTGNYVGLLAGESDGTITNSFASGAVSGDYQVGGLVGEVSNGGTITGSHAAVAVTGADDDIGGLVGTLNSGTITRSYASGAVAGMAWVGGLVGGLGGSQSAPAVISQSFATGSVSASAQSAGGLVGGGGGVASITDSYASGSAFAADFFVGGLVGSFGYGSGDQLTITNTYATGFVSSSTTNRSGGVLGGLSDGSLAITSSYWDTGTTGQTVAVGQGESASFASAGAASTSGLQSGVPSGWNSASIWSAVNGKSYPYLQWQFPAGTTPEVVTGTAYSDAGATPLAGGTVATAIAGSVVATASTGANGYYYDLLPQGTIGSGSTLLAYTGGANGGARLETVSDPVSGFDIWGGTLIAPTAATTYSTASATKLQSQNASLIATAVGSNTAAATLVGGLTNYGYIATGSGFTIDTTPASAALYVKTTASGAGITVAAPLTIANGLTLDAAGALAINAPITISGAGKVALGAAYGASLGTPILELSFAQGASINYGAVNNGGSLSINGAPYTLLYDMGTDATGVAGIANGLSGNYALATSLNASGVTGWTPLGTFTGAFEGLGNTISNLTISSGAVGSVGLFGVLSGTVADLGLANINVTETFTGNPGNGGVGGLAGYQDGGTISHVWTSGSVAAAAGSFYYDAGGLVGLQAAGVISQSSSSAAVGIPTNGGGSRAAGGLVGELLAGTVANSFATGPVTGYFAGGLVGRLDSGSISGSYAAGDVSASKTGGGLVAVAGGGAVSNSYWDAQTTGQSSSAGSASADGLTTAQLQSGLPSGFGNTVWGDVAGKSYPYLLSQFPSTPEVVSGVAYSDGGLTPLGGASVATAINGGNVATTYTGADGYYYNLLPQGAVSTSTGVLAYLTSGGKGSAFTDTVSASVTGLNIYGNTLRVLTADAKLSTATADLATAMGSLSTSNLPFTASGSGVAATSGNIEIDPSGSAFKINGAVSAAGTILVNVANGGLTLASGSSLSSAASGNAIVLVDGATFTNSGGALSLTGGGRFLIYSQNPANDNVGALTGGTIYSETYAANPPSSITASGNQFIYASAAPVTLLTYAVANASGTYGVTATPGAATLSGSPSGVTALVSIYNSSDQLVTLSGATPAGVYTEEVTGLAGANASQYQIASTGNTIGTLTINPAVLTVSATGVYSKTYGQTYTFGNSGYQVGGTLYNGDTLTSVTLSSGGAAATATVGSYTLTASNAQGSGLSNYTIDYISGGNLQVSPASLAITANNASKTYGTTFALGTTAYTVSGQLYGGDTLTGVTLSSAGAAASATVGGYTITPSAAQGNGLSNYSITYNSGQLSVTGAPLTITASNQSKTYGSTANLGSTAYTITSGQLYNGNTITGVTLYSPGSSVTWPAGSSTIYASNAAGSGLSNYAITYDTGTLTVNQAPLTVTANNQSKTYGSSLALGYSTAYTVTSGTLYNGDTLGTVYLTSAGAGSAATVAGGPYAITAQAAQGEAYNYNITYVNGSLTVNPALLTVSGGKVYDATTGFAVGQLAVAGGVNGETVTLTAGSGASSSANVGSYSGSALSGLTIKVTGGNGLASDYQLPTTGTLAITPEAVTITAAANTKTYDGSTSAAAAPTVTSGTLYGVDGATLSEAYATANAGSGLTINPSASFSGPNGGANYTVAYVASTAGAINPAPLTVSGSKTYDSTTGFTVGQLTVSGGVNGETATLTSGSGAASSANAGSYSGSALSGLAISVSGGNGLAANYALPATGALTINKEAITVTATANTKTYDGGTSASATPTVTAGTLYGVDGATLSEAYATANAGNGLTLNPSASFSGPNGGANYTVAYVASTAGVINPAPLTVSGSKTYDATTGFTVGQLTVSGGVNGETVNLTAGSGSTSSANAGTYNSSPLSGLAISVSGGNGLTSNYALPSTGALTITPATIALTLAGTKTYDGTTTFTGSNFGANGVISTGVAGQTLDLTGSGSVASANVSAGTQALTLGTLTLNNGTGLASDYQIASSGNTGTINPAPLTVSGAKVYDSTTGFSVGELTASGGVNGETVRLTSGSGAASSANAGVYSGSALSGLAISVSGGNGLASNYALPTAGALTITPEAVTITATANAKTYDGGTSASAAPTLTSGTLYGVDGATLSEAYATANAGNGLTLNPSASFSGPNGGANYTVAYVPSTAGEIAPAPLAITATNRSKTYGTALSLGTSAYTVSGTLYNSDALTGVTLTSAGAQASASVNSYAITASAAQGSGLSNYTITYNPGQLLVTDAPLTITASNQSKTYGGSVNLGSSAYTITSGQLYNSDAISGVTLYSPGSSATWPAGSSTIYASNAVGSGLSNYAITYATGTLTVNQAPLTITANNQSKTYGSSLTLGYSTAYTVTSGTLYNGDTVNSVYLTSAGAGAGATVSGSPYTIAVTANSAQGTGLYNYAITYVNGALTVNPAALTVTANNAAKTYDGQAYSGGAGVTYAGFVNGQSASVLSGTLTYGGTSQGAVNAGGYTLTASGLTSQNYAITYAPGSLTIGQAALTVTANNAAKTYDGQAYSGGAGVTYAGFVNGETSSVLSGTLTYGGTSQGAVNAGSYGLTASGLTAQNYAIAYAPGTLTVNPAAITVTADAESKTVGGVDPALAYQITSGGLVAGDALTGALTRVPGESVGAYAILQGSLAASANYDLTYVGADLTILAAPATTATTATSDAANYPPRQFAGPQVGGAATVVDISYQASGASSAPAIGVLRALAPASGAGGSVASAGASGSGAATKTASRQDPSQNIEPASGRTALFWPLSQFDRTQYTPGALPGYAPDAAEAAVLAIIARAEGANRQAPKIDLLWRAGRADWANLAADTAKFVKFSDGAGHLRTPVGDNGFALANGAVDIVALLKRGPVMLGAPTAPESVAKPLETPAAPPAPAGAAKPVDPPPAVADAAKPVDPPAAVPGNAAAATPSAASAPAPDPAKPAAPVQPAASGPPAETAKAKDAAAPGAWLLALELRGDGKSILADDPITGQQVVLAYDPATRTVGGVIGLVDPKTKTLGSLGAAPPNFGNPNIAIPAAAWGQLKAFRPASYFAVSL